MPASLLCLACAAAPVGGDPPDVAALTATANALADPADWRAAAAAADRLLTLAAGDGPNAAAAAAALADRGDRLHAVFKPYGIMTGREFSRHVGAYDDEIVLRVELRREVYDDMDTDAVPLPPGSPHPMVLMRPAFFGRTEVTLSQVGVFTLHMDAAQFGDLCRIPHLTSINLRAVPDLADDWLEPLRNHSTLRSFEIGEFSPSMGFINFPDRPTRLTPAGCATLATIPNLAAVGVSDTPVGDDGLRALAANPALKSVRLVNAGVTDAGLAALAGRELSGVNFAGNPITDAGFTALDLREVWDVDLSETGCGDASLDYLRGRWRDARSTPGRRGPTPGVVIDLSETGVTDAGLSTLAEVPKIDRLDLAGTSVTGAGFAAFADAGKKAGWTVYLADSNLDDAGCDWLSKSLNERRADIDCRNTPATETGFGRLAREAVRLDLTVGGPSITDAMIGRLAAVPSVRGLAVHDAPVTGAGFADVWAGGVPKEFRMVHCRTDDAGVAAMAGVPGVRSIWVVGGSVTDAAFLDLAFCDTLEDLWLREVPAGRPGLARLSEFRPAGPRGLRVRLSAVGLTDDVLESLPPMPGVASISFSEDPLTADAVVRFVENQPAGLSVDAFRCPAGEGDGPARIAAALAGRE